MSIFLNPVVFSVILMCILCLCKLNVMFSLIIACFVGGLMGGMSVSDISSTMLAGFSNNAEAALAYILLGTFASCLAYRHHAHRSRCYHGHRHVLWHDSCHCRSFRTALHQTRFLSRSNDPNDFLCRGIGRCRFSRIGCYARPDLRPECRRAT